MTRFGSELILARLQGLHPKAIDLSLGRIERLLAALGHPERELAPVVHIAGTNGKGSTLAMLDAMLQAAGHRVQRYISPHLVHFNERFLFDGEPIDEPELADVLDAVRADQSRCADHRVRDHHRGRIRGVRPARGGRAPVRDRARRPSRCHQRGDWPRLTALSPISLDHQAFLGERIEQIAFEKAGILKPAYPASSDRRRPRSAVIERRARADRRSAQRPRSGLASKPGRRPVIVEIGSRPCELRSRLVGCHQIDNAGLAVACALALRELAPDDGAIAEGLRSAIWPARLQRLMRGPLVERLPRLELWLDGGHNPAAGEALRASLNGPTGDPLHLVVGMLNTKDEPGFLRPLAPLAKSVHTVPVPDEAASRDPIEAAAEVARLGIAATPARRRSALGAIAAAEPEPSRVLVCGSLYVGGGTDAR